MVDLSLEGINLLEIWENSSRQRVPKPRGSRKEAVTVTFNTRVGQFYTISMRDNSLTSTAGPW